MDLKEEKICIHGIGINYLKIGTGEHPVLLLPGTLGSIWLHFKNQIENMNRERFTIIAWDPPGYGKSRPAPTRDFSDGFHQRDANLANDLMSALGYKTFSMIGFCDGGRTACVLAATYPDSIRKMILIGTSAYILPEELAKYKELRDLDSWPDRIVIPMVDFYGKDYMRTVWSARVDAMIDIYENRQGNICMDFLDKIQCSTLILHGEGDKFIKESHAMVLKEKIRNSSVYIFQKGGHSVHSTFPEKFNDLAQDFFLKGV